VSAGELTPSQTEELRRAVRKAEDDSELAFSVYLGPTEGEPRAHAQRLHAGLADPEQSVLVLCDPEARALEIVTGTTARRSLDDGQCALAAVSMQSSFEGGDLVGGLAQGLLQLGRCARSPRTLHSDPPLD
jgi:uncharacterized membrane protein YgcG